MLRQQIYCIGITGFRLTTCISKFPFGEAHLKKTLILKLVFWQHMILWQIHLFRLIRSNLQRLILLSFSETVLFVSSIRRTIVNVFSVRLQYSSTTNQMIKYNLVLQSNIESEIQINLGDHQNQHISHSSSWVPFVTDCFITIRNTSRCNDDSYHYHFVTIQVQFGFKILYGF